MRTRPEKDVAIIECEGVSLEAIALWVDELFGEYKDGDRLIDREVLAWWKEELLMNYQAAESEQVRRMIKVKILHTKEVVEAGFDIAGKSGEVEWDFRMVGVVSLLHDIGRFVQAHRLSFSDEKTGFDHAEEGAVMIEKKSFDNPWLMEARDRVAEAVRLHSRLGCESEDQYVRFARDADKLGLLRYMPYLIDMRIYKSEGVTEQALTDYLEGKIVRHRDMNTRADVCLAWAAWENDLNFSGTRDLYYSEGIKEWILSEVKRLGVTL